MVDLYKHNELQGGPGSPQKPLHRPAAQTLQSPLQQQLQQQQQTPAEAMQTAHCVISFTNITNRAQQQLQS